ncbi:MAG: hypothetical protein U5K81_12635 [Trueperaceae bacterium]|nr:hypothetical protein [Trueperaceae bacterium]
MTDDGTRIALELLEYKMDDLRRQRPVRGGVASVWELHARLSRRVDGMDPDDKQRFRSLSRELEGRRGGSAPPAMTGSERSLAFDDLVLDENPVRGVGGTARQAEDTPLVDFGEDDAPLLAGPERAPPASPEDKREQEALQRLAARVFGREVSRFADGVAAAWRAERERATARLMFATLRNFERHRQSPDFARDANLRQFRVTEPIPQRGDPLLDLTNVDSLSVVARELVEAILYLRDGNPAPQIERRQSFDYMRRLALEVAKDPYAGKRSPVDTPGPSASDLRTALRDLGRERLPEWQRQARRQELERRIRERQELEREQRTMLRRDTMRFTELAEAFFVRLARLLPRSVGGDAEEPQLTGGVLFAVSDALRRKEIPADARTLTLRLAGPVRLAFLGRTLAVTVEGRDRHLFLEDREVPLDGDRVTSMNGYELETFVEGDYVHVRARDTGGSLVARVAEAATALFVLTSPQAEMRLAALRLLAPGAAAEPVGVVAEAVRRAGQIVVKAPDRHQAMERLVAGSVRAVGGEAELGWLQGFVQRAMLALAARPEQLPEALAMLISQDPAAEEPTVAPFSGEPVDVTVGGRTVTVRTFGAKGGDHLVAMLPGQVIGSFREHLVEQMGAGTIACVFGEQQLVAAYLPGTRVRAAHDASA